MQVPVLILHGWGGSKQSWQKCSELFDKKRYKLYVPDLPGFGSSPAPKKAWNLDDYARHVKKIMKEYKINQPICIAHSFGGRIAIKLASKDKELFSKLFLVAAAGIKHKPTLKIRIFRVISKIGKAIFKIPGLGGLRGIARKILYKAARGHDYYKTDGTMRETFKNVIDEDLSPYLKEIKTETHVIWGDKDSYVPVSDAYIMKEEIDGATIDVIEEGKHGLHIQVPEKLIRIINKYT